MKKYLRRSLIVCGCLTLSSITVLAQKHNSTTGDSGGSAAVSVVKGAGKAGVVVAGSAAKATWWTTKFVVKDVAKPVAGSVFKTVVTKGTPLAAKFVLKNSVKYVLPFAAKLSLL